MRSGADDLGIEVREGTVEDVPLLLSFLRSMAEFEKLEVLATEESLRKSLFGDDPAAKILLVDVDERPAAYATYFFSFASMVGKRGLWLDDVYVNPEYRGRGIARALMSHLAGIAIEHDCGRFEWMVLDWNKSAIDFYRNLGASVLDEWRICRLDQNGISRVAANVAKCDETS